MTANHLRNEKFAKHETKRKETPPCNANKMLALIYGKKIAI